MPNALLDPAATSSRARAILRDGSFLHLFLDLSRSIAAFAVLLFHARTWLYLPYPELQSHSLALWGFYTATTFGHDAVIVFFVLSGFLVGGSVLRTDFRSPLAVTRYAAARIARIWPVLLGAVGLSLLLSRIGSLLAPTDFSADSAATVVANMLAVNNIGFRPPLANNLPLWSISNEVAYYLFFPVFIAVYRNGFGVLTSVLACCSAVIIVASLALTPLNDQNLALYAPIWAMGSCLWLLPARRYPFYPGLCMFVVGLLFARTDAGRSVFLVRDMITASGFSLCLLGLFGRTASPAGGPRPFGTVARLASFFASFSFSLYVTHGPIILLYKAVLARAGYALPLSDLRWLPLLGLLLVCLMSAWLFSIVFEKYHHRMAALLVTVFAKPERA